MRSFLDPRRASSRLASLASLATLALLAGCATATRRTAASSGVPTARSSEATRPTQQKYVLVRADSAYQAGAYPLAGALYEGIVTQDPSPASIAIFRLATLRSWDNQLDDAVALYRRYITLEPRDAEGRLALARTLASVSYTHLTLPTI